MNQAISVIEHVYQKMNIFVDVVIISYFTKRLPMFSKSLSSFTFLHFLSSVIVLDIGVRCGSATTVIQCLKHVLRRQIVKNFKISLTFRFDKL
jgi:hypothetical protein